MEGARHSQTGRDDARRPRAEHGPRRSLRADDRGVSILEFAGFLPFLLLIGMAAIQLGLVGYSANQAGSGARAAARVQSQGGDGTGAGQAAMSGWLDADIDAGGGGGDTTTATVTVHVPVLVPFLDEQWDVRRTATMPNDRDPEGG
ncbi:TadE/TadG family type IV pilus assembly protein [Streptomyces sp. NBC_00009]|uniref:TadE/TadG family type IV pilus assembly protein n=1 Tax=Streptomyces sp. NBC_00009 TaxID=2975620 RepID=UPI0038647E85